jgi:hypothetical protein
LAVRELRLATPPGHSARPVTVTARVGREPQADSERTEGPVSHGTLPLTLSRQGCAGVSAPGPTRPSLSRPPAQLKILFVVTFIGRKYNLSLKYG